MFGSAARLPLAVCLLLCGSLISIKPAVAAQTSGEKQQPRAKQPANSESMVTRQDLRAVFDTSMGRMVCRLFPKRAPKTTANFVGLATGRKTWTDPKTHKKMMKKPFYDGTIFHRVIPDFIIQGGDRLGTGAGGPGYTFDDEIAPGLKFDVAGRLAMANRGPNTSGSQFFITLTPQPQLDRHYSIFGQCDSGSVLVAESIAQVPRNRQNKPIEPVVLDKVTIVQPGRSLPPVAGAKPHHSSSSSHR
jgi:peptidyl-prolyl cis-trans isomerase A (cyclophilin A)